MDSRKARMEAENKFRGYSVVHERNDMKVDMRYIVK